MRRSIVDGYSKNVTKIGIIVQDLYDEIAEELGYNGEQGVLVKSIIPGSPGQQAGLTRGDLIKTVNQQPIK